MITLQHFFAKRLDEFRYYQLQHEINQLHHEISKPSIKLGQLTKEKCRIEHKIDKLA